MVFLPSTRYGSLSVEDQTSRTRHAPLHAPAGVGNQPVYQLMRAVNLTLEDKRRGTSRGKDV